MKIQIHIFKLLFPFGLITMAACRGAFFQSTLAPSPTIVAQTVQTSRQATAYAQITKEASSPLPTSEPSVTNNTSPTASLTIALEPTLQPLEKLQPLSSLSGPGSVAVVKGVPPTFLRVEGTLPNQPGSYAIYQTWNGGIGYISTDKTIKGELLGNRNVIAKLPDFSMTSDQTSPKLIFVREAGSDKYVWITTLTGKSLENWHIRSESSLYCGLPLISASGRWMIVFCFEEKVYLNLINLETGETKVISTPCMGALSPIPSGIAWAEANWSEDDRQLNFWCRYRHYYCFLSTQDGNGICKDIKKTIWSISPNWSRAILGSDVFTSIDDKMSIAHGSVVDLECVLKESNCGQGEIFDFTYPQGVSDILNSSISILWSKSERNFALVYTNDLSEEPSHPHYTCYWVDPDSHTSQEICQRAADSAKLAAITPDDKQWLFQGKNKLFLASMINGLVDYLVEDQYDPIFHGWLVVP